MALGISAATWAGIGAVGSVGVGLYNGSQAADAAQGANAATQAGNQAAIAEQQRQFDAIQQLLSPYVNAGTGALAGQQNLLGLNGNGAQQTAIDGIRGSAAYTSALQAGENSILQNASATGGLRGGNVQSALSQFSPQLLAQLIQQQYSNLGGLSSMGQNAAAGVGNAGMSTGNNISNLLSANGQSNAANALAQGQTSTGGLNSLLGGIGAMGGLARYNAAGAMPGAFQTGAGTMSDLASYGVF